MPYITSQNLNFFKIAKVATISKKNPNYIKTVKLTLNYFS